jgi:(p)ppGpp synthase/HD superfamily hydrolase
MSKLIKLALSYATENHFNQKYGNLPYMHHLVCTSSIACKFGYDDTIQAACLLHDILEETKKSYTDLKLVFDEEIAEIVYCVTDELGRNRNERKAKTYPKTLANPKAIIVKLCDRSANIENAVITNNTKKIFLYKREHGDFVTNLYIENTCILLWNDYFKLIHKLNNE